MNMLNSIILEGVVTSGLSENPCGKDFDITVSRYYKNAEGDRVEEKSDFCIELYGNLAERDIIMNKIYFDRSLEIVGRGVRVVGRLKQKRWTDEEGKEHSKVVVIAEHIEFKS